MLHYYIGRDTIASDMRRSKLKAHLIAKCAGLIHKRQRFAWFSRRKHYTNFVSPDAMGVLPEEGERDQILLTPVANGRPVTIYEARRRWKKLIE